MSQAKRRYVRTDLAAELLTENEQLEGLYSHTYTEGAMQITVTEITSQNASQALGKPQGRYVMLDIDRLWLRPRREQEELCSALQRQLRTLLDTVAPRAQTVLCVGLGNREITPDALGPLTVARLTVTRHLQSEQPQLFRAAGGRSLCAIAPGVIGQTGIETAEQVRGAVEHVKPEVIFVIDALAARSADRLAASIQLTDTGIHPGAGVGNRRCAITRAELGVPVIVIGVPTVVDSSTLIYDTLSQAGIDELSPSLREILDNSRSYFVTLKDSDAAVESLAQVIADALNRLLLPALQEE